MKNRIPYFLLLIGLTAFFCGCQKTKTIDKRISLWHLDKIPYGTKYAYENLSFIFPKAVIRTSRNFPVLYSNESAVDTLRALIVISPTFAPDPQEMNSIIRFAASGNQVFISARYFNDSVLKRLHCALHNMGSHLNDSMEIKVRGAGPEEWLTYQYPGYSNDAYFESIDTGHSTILGKNSDGNSDFIRLNYKQGGAIFLHVEPFAFSNFFLLHKNNKSYYDEALSSLPKEIGLVEWSDYFRYTQNSKPFSAMVYVLSNRSLRWAFWVTIGLFLLVFLVESKRKQRSIAEMPPLRNASQDFVKTVGRLYFQQKNNQNLGAKMVAAFLENIRSRYNLSTSVLDEEFTHQLAFRAGRPEEQIREIVQLIHITRLRPDLSDQELMDLHHQINQFNKQA